MIAPDQDDVSRSVRTALTEDVGSGDLTASLIPPRATASARIVLREPATLCGQAWVNETFRLLDDQVEIKWFFDDGASCAAGCTICQLNGSARSLLTGERTALNFLQTLSATATRTAEFCEAIAGTNARILDTRKTLPGLRLAQKYAVRCGGGENHRIGLFDAVLIKENHLAASESIHSAVSNAVVMAPEALIEVEVESQDQLMEALDSEASRVLLDNFTLEMLKEAVRRRDAHPAAQHKQLEASGNITIDNVRDYALTGIDFISVGSLTKNVAAIDFSMLFG